MSYRIVHSKFRVQKKSIVGREKTDLVPHEGERKGTVLSVGGIGSALSAASGVSSVIKSSCLFVGSDGDWSTVGVMKVGSSVI